MPDSNGRNAAMRSILDRCQGEIQDLLGVPVSLIYRLKVSQITPEQIKQVVCKVCNVTWSDVVANNREQEVLVPRCLFIWLVAYYCGFTHERISILVERSRDMVTHTLSRMNTSLEINDPLYVVPLQKIEQIILKLQDITNEAETIIR